MAHQFDSNMHTIPFQLTKTMHRDPYDDILRTNPTNSRRGKIVIITGVYGGIGTVGLTQGCFFGSCRANFSLLQASASVWARAGASVVLAGRKADQLANVSEAGSL